MYRIYTDGACQGNPGPGGWCALVFQDTKKAVLRGRVASTTNNRMEVLAAIKGLEHTPAGSEAIIYSDSQYLVNTMTRNWKRNANQDLWQRLDELTASRDVRWEWVKGHAGHPQNEEADRIANELAGIVSPNKADGQQAAPVLPPPGAPPEVSQLTHLDASGQARMVDIGAKADTEREAMAAGQVVMKPQTFALLKAGQVAKGDVLSVARVAGVMAAKRTHELIPLCHPLLLTHIQVDFVLNEADSAVDIKATVHTTGKTGVEMEALTAVSVAALTIYDMCKAVEKGIRIQNIRLVRKSGGKSGEVRLE